MLRKLSGSLIYGCDDSIDDPHRFVVRQEGRPLAIPAFDDDRFGVTLAHTNFFDLEQRNPVDGEATHRLVLVDEQESIGDQQP